jgi:hypothetical protein
VVARRSQSYDRGSHRHLGKDYFIPEDCQGYVRDKVVSANISQDTQHFNDFERHYNRPYRAADERAEDDPAAAMDRANDGLYWEMRYEMRSR